MPVEQLRSKRRHERILDSALRVFSQKGYCEAAVDDVAAEAATSKGGIYFHFPTKQAIFLALLDRTAALLRSKVEAAIAPEPDPLARAELALEVVLETFGSHRTLARLFFVEALGAGREFNERMAELRADFSALIRRHLDEAVRQGRIGPLDTAVASQVWFGALNEVLTRWALAERPEPLEDVLPTLRPMLMRSIGAEPMVPTSSDGEPPVGAQFIAPSSVKPPFESEGAMNCAPTSARLDAAASLVTGA